MLVADCGISVVYGWYPKVAGRVQTAFIWLKDNSGMPFVSKSLEEFVSHGNSFKLENLHYFGWTKADDM